MNAPVETPLICESTADHVHTSSPEFSPLAGTGPDLELPTSASVVPVVRDAFSLISAIENFISLRDQLWHSLALNPQLSAINLRPLGLLETANQACAAMLTLRSGPTTPVLDPAHAHIEILRCNVCEIFIARARHEIASLDTTVTPNGVRILASIINQRSEVRGQRSDNQASASSAV